MGARNWIREGGGRGRDLGFRLGGGEGGKTGWEGGMV